MASDEAVLLVRIEAQLRQFERAMARAGGAANSAAGRIETRFRRMDRNLSVIGSGLARTLIGPLTAALSAREIARYADAWTRVGRALETTENIFGARVKSAEELVDIALRTRSALEPLTTLYTRIAQATRNLGFSQEEVATSAETIAKALKLGGASGEEQASVLTQLSQALIKGKLDGDEFRSVMENASVIQLALARRLNVSTAALQKMSQDGLIGVNDLMGALLDAAPEVSATFEGMPSTIGEAWTNLKTTLIQTVGTFNEATGSTAGLVQAMNDLARGIQRVGNAFEAFASLSIVQRLSAEYDALDDSITRLLGAAFRGNFKKALGVIDEGFTVAAEDARDLADAIEAAKEAVKNSDPIEPADIIAGPEIVAETERVVQRVNQAFRDAGIADPLGTFKPPPEPPEPPERDEATLAIERQQDAVEELISDLEFENRMIGLGNEQREIEVALRRAGAVATPEQRKQIELLVAAGVREQDALDGLIDRMDELRDAAGGALSAFNDSIREGEGLAGGLKSALENVLNTVIRIAEQQAITSLFGKFGTAGGGGGIGRIIGGLFGGGGATAAAPFTLPAVTGLRPAVGGGGQAAVVRLVIDENEMFASRVVGISGAVAVQAVKSNNRAIPGMIADRRARGL